MSKYLYVCKEEICRNEERGIVSIIFPYVEENKEKIYIVCQYNQKNDEIYLSTVFDRPINFEKYNLQRNVIKFDKDVDVIGERPEWGLDLGISRDERRRYDINKKEFASFRKLLKKGVSKLKKYEEYLMR
ncbi:MAG: hypothetical protein B6U78_00225 [Candidatus Aenigmarchaeota archaeon ex4484_224]|nr:MAG: hypothetical protein B6U78_00225 [Candidatus Aenigmarchaeota archaeon ex4484_224]